MFCISSQPGSDPRWSLWALNQFDTPVWAPTPWARSGLWSIHGHFQSKSSGCIMGNWKRLPIIKERAVFNTLACNYITESGNIHDTKSHEITQRKNPSWLVKLRAFGQTSVVQTNQCPMRNYWQLWVDAVSYSAVLGVMTVWLFVRIKLAWCKQLYQSWRVFLHWKHITSKMFLPFSNCSRQEFGSPYWLKWFIDMIGWS